MFNEYTKQKQYNRKIRYIITEERMNKNLLLSGMVVLLLIIVGLSGCEEELSQDDETIYAELNVPFRVGDYNVVFSNVHYSKYAYFEGWRWVEIDVKVTNSYGKQASSIYLYAPSIGVSGGYFYNGFGPDTYFTAIEHPFESYETNFRYRIPNNRSAIRLNITYKLDMLQENSIPIVLEDFTTFIDYEKYLEKFVGIWKRGEILSTFYSDGTYVSEGNTYYWEINDNKLIISSISYIYYFYNENQSLTLIRTDSGRQFDYIKQS